MYWTSMSDKTKSNAISQKLDIFKRCTVRVRILFLFYPTFVHKMVCNLLCVLTIFSCIISINPFPTEQNTKRMVAARQYMLSHETFNPTPGDFTCQWGSC